MFRQWRRLLLMTSALAPLTVVSAVAGPNGATVVGGSATVQGQGTANVVVNQTSQSAIINWNTFNIGTGQTTQINMPSASSVELDRVTGGLGPSQIMGSLSSNGNVFLVNPDGILFGAGSRINVGGLLATTNNISNADFMAGKYRFTIPGNPAASIVNQGSITAQTGGFAALVAPGVRNTGTITANLGTIALASGNAFTLDFYGDNLIKLGLNDSIASQVIDVSTGKPLSSLVSNAGTLQANGGKVELTAVAARKVVDSVINNTGNIEANSIGTHNGMIVLEAATAANKPNGAPTQTVKVSGTLSAAGTGKGTTGGTIVVTGENVQLNGANVNASGPAGGGAVLIGGDWGGGHPNTGLVSNPSAYLQPYAVPTASTVSIDAATTINASATNAGNGGKVIVWSNEATTFYGTILAQGGPQSGQGGFVETSGHQLSFNGIVNTNAPNGANGTLLLDPGDYYIQASGAPAPPSGASVITNTELDNELALGNVVIATNNSISPNGQNGDIFVAANLNWTSANSLTLNAYRNITIDNGVTVTNTGAGNLVLRADDTGTGNGTVNLLGASNIDFSGSTGTVSIFYNPVWFTAPRFCEPPCSGGPPPVVEPIPKNYAPSVLTNILVTNLFTAYMLVNTADHLQDIEYRLSGDYALSKDIVLNSTTNWTPSAIAAIPLPVYSMVRVIRLARLTINNPTLPAQRIGRHRLVFGDTNGAVISNVGLTDISITPHSFPGTIGGLIGQANNTTVSNSYVTGAINASSDPSYTGGLGPIGGSIGYMETSSVSQLYAAVTIQVSNASSVVISAIGGLVGFNNVYGSIVDSYATGSITNTAFSFYGTGGLVGSNWGTVSQSYATGQVNGGLSSYGIGGLVGSNQGGTIKQSYATGGVTGSSFNGLGGLVGSEYYQGSISESYATGTVQGGLLTSPFFASNGEEYTGSSGGGIGGLVGFLNASAI